MKKYHYSIDTQERSGPAQILHAVGRDKQVLEVGCASGTQSRALTEHFNCIVTGIELDDVAAREAERFCQQVIVGDVESMDLGPMFEHRRFDVILLADVLEHLRDPASVLEKLKRYLATDGYIVASIPNVVHSALVLEMIHGRFDYRPYGLLDDTHLRFFTKRSIFQLFEACGLKISFLDRVHRKPEETEFYCHPYNEVERGIMDYMHTQNPECETFQFIVRAVPAINGIGETHALLEANDRIKDLERTNMTLESEKRRLESQIAWVTKHPLYRFLSRAKHLFR